MRYHGLTAPRVADREHMPPRFPSRKGTGGRHRKEHTGTEEDLHRCGGHLRIWIRARCGVSGLTAPDQTPFSFVLGHICMVEACLKSRPSPETPPPRSPTRYAL
ncbi:hypothetical protein GCM10022205_28730 [Spinactinospora alkalitolerans]